MRDRSSPNANQRKALPATGVGPSGLLRHLRSGMLALLATAAALPAWATSGTALAERDAHNKRLSEQLQLAPNGQAAAPTARYNHIITFGQSLASAAEGWPALSTEARYDNLMLGQAVRSATFSGASFEPVGKAAFTPLRAGVQHKSDARVILEPAQVAQLEKHAQEEGESVDIGALNMARRLYLHQRGSDSDPQHLFLASNAATSGRSIAQLSKTGGTHEYRRVPQAMDQAKALADAENASYAVSAFFWLQGEFDYSHTNGGVNDKARYKQLARQLRDDLYDDTRAITGQTRMPAFISYQTDAKSSVKDGALAVGMAQWELAQEEPNWFLAGPVYPYVDKGVHLSANGYRWFGQMLGKVYHRVAVEGRKWQPLAPRRATVAGREILLDFHVPAPPLQFADPYIGHVARPVKNKGFMVYDDQGEVPLEAVDIAADTIVRLRAGRDLAGQPRITYASFQVGGAGQLRDSDATQADASYEYLPEQGMPEEANIPALVGKPYPLQNWSIAFELVAKPGQALP